MSAIRIENLQKVYGSVHALDGLTLNVEENTIFGFLGPNGAGKSTTIRLLTGLARPTGGNAWVAGHALAESRKAAAKIGYLPEEPAFYNWMSPQEFLDHVGRTFGLNQAERRARTAQLLERVGLAAVGKRRIAGFSRGMRQRLGLAQALVNQPEVLLLDEPVSALDPAGRKEVLDMILSLRGNCTVFMSTHILADVERVCDTIGIINRGKLVIEARQDELMTSYTVPAFELECENGSVEPFRTWVQTLNELPWVSNVTLNGAVARIGVSSVETARRQLLEMVLQQGFALRRFEIVTPSLEDIFLRLVGKETQA